MYPVCGYTHTHNCGVLLDQGLQNNLNRTTVTGFGLCEEHEKMYNDGYIALVVVDPERTKNAHSGRVRAEGVFRTGELLFLRKEVVRDIFNISEDDERPLLFIDELMAMYLTARLKRD